MTALWPSLYEQGQRLFRVNKAQGSWIYDDQGHAVLDAISSWWVNLFGHGKKEILDAIADQAQRLDHILLAGVVHESAEQLAHQLTRLTPFDLNHVFFAADGASAVEIALKMALHFWQNEGAKEKIAFAALSQGYHGETLGALVVSDLGLYKAPYQSLLQDAFFLPVPLSDEAIPEALAQAERILATHQQKLAALIVEPLLQGAGGMRMYPKAYLQSLYQLCQANRILLIADEIATGFGRTGSMFAIDQAGITPDIMCLSKGITGGVLPLSAVIVKTFIHEILTRPGQAFLHSHSYSGNALACAAALATLRLFESEDILAGNRTKQAFLNQHGHILSEHEKTSHFRNLGMVWAFEVSTTDHQFPQTFRQMAWENGLLLRPLGHTVYFMPPYSITEEEILFLLDNTLNTIEQYFRQHPA